jgi:hypothetical protein
MVPCKDWIGNGPPPAASVAKSFACTYAIESHDTFLAPILASKTLLQRLHYCTGPYSALFLTTCCSLVRTTGDFSFDTSNEVGFLSSVTTIFISTYR